MYAITPQGVGKPVGFRAIESGWPLAPGETFTVAENPEGKVLAAGEQSLEDGSLEIAKMNALASLKAQRDAFAEGGVVYGGHTYDSDERSQKLLAAVVAGVGAGIPLPAGFYWTTADDVDVPHTPQSIVALGAAMIELGNTAHHRYRVAKEAVKAASTVQEVEAVTF